MTIIHALWGNLPSEVLEGLKKGPGVAYLCDEPNWLGSISSVENKSVVLVSPIKEFISSESNQFEPSRELGLDLEGDHVILIKNPIDLWIEMGMPSSDRFFRELLGFVEIAGKTGTKIVHLEDLKSSPTLVPSALGGLSKIELPLRPLIPAKKIEVVQNSEILKELCKELGYSSSYFSRPVQNWGKGGTLRKKIAFAVSKLKNELKWRLRYAVAAPAQRYAIIQHERVKLWMNDNRQSGIGEEYKLTSESIVVEVGGFKGVWTEQMWKQYHPHMYIFEPVVEYVQELQKKFGDNPKIHILPYGLAGTNREETISSNDDASSVLRDNIQGERILLRQAKEAFTELGLEQIDVMQINIEGGEYELLEHLLAADIVDNIKNIKVQFHSFVKGAKYKAESIQSRLSNSHRLTYQYKFVWENWRKV